MHSEVLTLDLEIDSDWDQNNEYYDIFEDDSDPYTTSDLTPKTALLGYLNFGTPGPMAESTFYQNFGELFYLSFAILTKSEFRDQLEFFLDYAIPETENYYLSTIFIDFTSPAINTQRYVVLNPDFTPPPLELSDDTRVDQITLTAVGGPYTGDDSIPGVFTFQISDANTLSDLDLLDFTVLLMDPDATTPTLVTSDGGGEWTLTVEAEDGTTDQYTIFVTIVS